MEQKVNIPFGTINRAFRPSLDYENTVRRWTIYDPNRPFNFGLYANGPREVSESFPDYFHNLMRELPRSGIKDRKKCSACQNW
jgi:hypothetical protein